MGKAPDGNDHQIANAREIFIWHEQARVEDNTKRLSAVIAARTASELFNAEGVLSRLHDGRLVPVVKEDMRLIIDKHVKSIRLVNRGTASEPRLEIEYFSLDFPPTGSKHDLNRGPNERTLIGLIAALVPLMAKAPGQPVELKPQQLQEIRTRLKSNEPAYLIARSYNVDVEVILELARVRS